MFVLASCSGFMYICLRTDGFALHDKACHSGSFKAVSTASSAECKACGEESAGLDHKIQVKLASEKQEVNSKCIQADLHLFG